MKLYGVENIQDLHEIMMTVSKGRYKNNLTFNRIEYGHGNSVNFTLRVKDSKSPGHRLSFSGRRLVSACWHAHRDFMIELFEKFPKSRLISALRDNQGYKKTTQGVTYNGKTDFYKKYPETECYNIGSSMTPLYMGDACDCRDTMCWEPTNSTLDTILGLNHMGKGE